MAYGTNNADTITDQIGKDDIDALGGNDLIILATEDFSEIVNGGLGQDTVSLVKLGMAHVDLGDGTLGTAFVQNTRDLLVSIENVIGTSGGDTIYGSGVGNELFGFGGNDFIEGRSGADKISGGAGFDTASYEQSNTGVTVHLDTGFGYGGHATGDRLYEIERVVGSTKGDLLVGDARANTLEGGGGNDLLEGRDGRDVLIGGAGADQLVGGRGGDRLTGGGDADLFVFENPAESYFMLGRTDTITDFNSSVGDRIDLATIDARPGKQGNQAFTFVGDDAFDGVGQVRAYADGDDMIVEVNATNQQGAEMIIVVADIVSLMGGDFIL